MEAFESCQPLAPFSKPLLLKPKYEALSPNCENGLVVAPHERRPLPAALAAGTATIAAVAAALKTSKIRLDTAFTSTIAAEQKEQTAPSFKGEH
jgi:hypothetical protein